MRARLLATGVVLLSACQSTGAFRPATLAQDTPETRLILIEAVRGLTKIPAPQLGAVDLTTSSEVPILPAAPTALEGNSPAMPEFYAIVSDGTECYIQPRMTPTDAAKIPRARLPNIACRAVKG
jgi:hypothetical protein